MRILIVDDHILFQEGLVSLIDSQPDLTVVGSADSVESAVTKACLLAPDVILMDFSLPDGTGLDATIQILAKRPSTNIIFLTVSEDDDRLFEAIRFGAKGYLIKDIPGAQLLRYIRGLQNGEAAISLKLTAHILREFAHTYSHQVPLPEVASQLTDRQRQILRELRAGASNRQIALKLALSEQTVKNYVSHILTQLDLTNRYEAAEFARRHKI
jgi:two-component system NarL family response regulator